MGFWIFMLLMDMIIPLSMIGFGRYFMKNSPQKINMIFGYRTSMSMKNQDTWVFAHHYFGKLWYVGGWGLLPLSILVMLMVIGKPEDPVGAVGGVLCFVQMIPMLGAIIPTERALRRTFDKDGNRR